MKKDLHPTNYRLVVFEDLNDGTKILTRSTVASEETIKWGCKHSSDMMCFPYKVTLGNLKEALDKGGRDNISVIVIDLDA